MLHYSTSYFSTSSSHLKLGSILTLSYHPVRDTLCHLGAINDKLSVWLRFQYLTLHCTKALKSLNPISSLSLPICHGGVRPFRDLSKLPSTE